MPSSHLSELFNFLVLEREWRKRHHALVAEEDNMTVLEREQLAQHILQALEGIRYGAVEIIVHESRIVQIERKEKLRFDARKG